LWESWPNLKCHNAEDGIVMSLLVEKKLTEEVLFKGNVKKSKANI